MTRNPFPRALSRSSAFIAVAVAGLALAGFAPGASAGDSNRKSQEIAAIRAAVARGELLPLPRIIAIARAKVPGDVVKTEIEHEHGRLVYEVKILTASGRVREIELDARSGAVLKIEDD